MSRLLLLPLFAVFLSACPESSCPEGDPAILSFTVEADTVTAGEALSATLELQDFELGEHEDMEMDDDDMADDDDDMGEDAECHGGHAHVYLDSLEVNPLAMPEMLTFEVTIPADTTPGEHTLIARLHNEDHTILEPQVTAEVTVTVEAP